MAIKAATKNVVPSKSRSKGYQSPGKSRKKKSRLSIGTLWRHPRSGRIYWRYIPHGQTGCKKRLQIPMVPDGAEHATKEMMVAEAIAKRHIARLKGEPVRFSNMDDLLKAHHQTFPISKKRAADDSVSKIADFLKFSKIQTPAQITTRMINAYLRYLEDSKAGMGLQPGTVRKYKNALSKFCKTLIVDSFLDNNPARYASFDSHYTRPPREVPDESVLKLIARAKDIADDAVHVAILIAAECGLRLSEILNLCWGDIRKRGNDFSEYVLVVGGTVRPKSNRSRIVPLPDYVHAAICNLPLVEYSMENFDGTKLLAARKASGMVQQQLADAAGLSANYISTLERGGQKPRRGAAEKIAEALNVKISTFYTPHRIRLRQRNERIFVVKWDSREWDKVQWVRAFKKLADGLDGFGPILPSDRTSNWWHALRHYCATRKAASGMTTFQLQYEMGWSSIKMAETYVNLAQATGVRLDAIAEYQAPVASTA